MKAFLTIISITFFFLAFIPYFRDIKKEKIKTQVVSWFGWGVVTLLGGVAMLNDVFNWASVFVLANTLICFLVVIYSVYKKVAVFKTTKYDFIFILFAVLGLVLWQTTGNPDLAIIFAIIADFNFGLLTLIKTYRDPNSESKQAWLLIVIANTFALFVVSYISFTEIAYPVFMFLYDLLVLLLVYKIIKKPELKKEST